MVHSSRATQTSTSEFLELRELQIAAAMRQKEAAGLRDELHKVRKQAEATLTSNLLDTVAERDERWAEKMRHLERMHTRALENARATAEAHTANALLKQKKLIQQQLSKEQEGTVAKMGRDLERARQEVAEMRVSLGCRDAELSELQTLLVREGVTMGADGQAIGRRHKRSNNEYVEMHKLKSSEAEVKRLGEALQVSEAALAETKQRLEAEQQGHEAAQGELATARVKLAQAQHDVEMLQESSSKSSDEQKKTVEFIRDEAEKSKTAMREETDRKIELCNILSARQTSALAKLADENASLLVLLKSMPTISKAIAIACTPPPTPPRSPVPDKQASSFEPALSLNERSATAEVSSRMGYKRATDTGTQKHSSEASERDVCRQKPCDSEQGGGRIKSQASRSGRLHEPPVSRVVVSSNSSNSYEMRPCDMAEESAALTVRVTRAESSNSLKKSQDAHPAYPINPQGAQGESPPRVGTRIKDGSVWLEADLQHHVCSKESKVAQGERSQRHEAPQRDTCGLPRLAAARGGSPSLDTSPQHHDAAHINSRGSPQLESAAAGRRSPKVIASRGEGGSPHGVGAGAESRCSHKATGSHGKASSRHHLVRDERGGPSQLGADLRDAPPSKSGAQAETHVSSKPSAAHQECTSRLDAARESASPEGAAQASHPDGCVSLGDAKGEPDGSSTGAAVGAEGSTNLPSAREDSSPALKDAHFSASQRGPSGRAALADGSFRLFSAGDDSASTESAARADDSSHSDTSHREACEPSLVGAVHGGCFNRKEEERLTRLGEGSVKPDAYDGKDLDGIARLDAAQRNCSPVLSGAQREGNGTSQFEAERGSVHANFNLEECNREGTQRLAATHSAGLPRVRAPEEPRVYSVAGRTDGLTRNDLAPPSRGDTTSQSPLGAVSGVPSHLHRREASQRDCSAQLGCAQVGLAGSAGPDGEGAFLLGSAVEATMFDAKVEAGGGMSGAESGECKSVGSENAQ
ncbi:MAG: hypothetical protein SGPRY_009124, partial [Prymnesium sp.]